MKTAFITFLLSLLAVLTYPQPFSLKLDTAVELSGIPVSEAWLRVKTDISDSNVIVQYYAFPEKHKGIIYSTDKWGSFTSDSVPPVYPNPDIYLIQGSVNPNEWTGQTGKIAIWTDSTWIFYNKNQKAYSFNIEMFARFSDYSGENIWTYLKNKVPADISNKMNISLSKLTIVND